MSRERPAGWRRVRLGDVASESRARNVDLEIPPERLVGVFKDQGMQPMRERVRGSSIERCKVVEPGAFAYNPMRINIGSIARSDAAEQLLVSPDYVVFEPDETKIDGDFLDLLRKSEPWAKFVGHAGDGGVRIRIYFDHLAEFRFALPPLPEQRRIAEILSSVDEAIAATRAVIEQTKTVKQAVLDRLLIKGIGHTRFKRTEIGEIPEAWDVVHVSDVAASIDSGWSPDCERAAAAEEEWGVLKTTAVVWGGYQPHENKKLPDSLTPRPEIEVKTGDVLVTRAGPVERTGVVALVRTTPQKLMLSDKIIRIQTKEDDCLPSFLRFWLSSPRAQEEIIKKKSGMAQSQTNISQKSLRQLLVPLPPLDEQIDIADAVQSVDESISAESAKLDALIMAKSALMSDLLTGRKRVTDALHLAAE